MITRSRGRDRRPGGRARYVSAATLVGLAVMAASCSGSSDLRATGTVREGVTVPRSSGTTSATTPGTTRGTTPGTTPADDPSPQQVQAWQTELNAVGCNAGYADGEIGPGTRAAVTNFQVAMGLDASGDFDDATVSALDDAYGKGVVVCTPPPTTAAPTTAAPSTSASTTVSPTSSPTTTPQVSTTAGGGG